MTEKKHASTTPWVDPDDAPELTDEFFAKAKKMIGDRAVSDDEFREAVKKAARGRPRKPRPKISTTVRLSPEVVEYFRSTGKGWQTRLDEVLREYVASRQ